MRPQTPRLLAFLVVAGLLAVPRAAHAGIGIGLFIGEPTGLTFKVDLKRRTAIEVLLGVEGFDEGRGRGPYGHFTFLAAPFVAHGESVVVPFRLGIGVAVYDDDNADFGDNVAVAARAPFELAFQFRSSPVEIYLELALRLEIIDTDDRDNLDLDGGIGFRIYF